MLIDGVDLLTVFAAGYGLRSYFRPGADVPLERPG